MKSLSLLCSNTFHHPHCLIETFTTNVSGSDARQEFEACIGVFNGVNFWGTQVSASFNNAIILQNKENTPENEMQHGILQDYKQRGSLILMPDNKTAAYLQTLKDMKIKKEKKRWGCFQMKESFYILYSNMFSLSCLKLSNMSQVHFKCNTSDHYKRNTVLVTFGLFFLTGRHQQKQILPGNMDGLFFGRLR